MIPGREYTAEEILGMVWKRKWFICVSFAVITTATVVITSRLPDRFRAETLILAAAQSVSTDYVRNTVANDTKAKDRLPSLSQQILSRPRLERIILDLDLYADLRAEKPMEVAIERMSNNIEIKPVESSEVFRVSYEARDPDVATKVTERLAGFFVEENSRDRTVMARETSEFLESQLVTARKRLVEQEKRLEAYRLRYGPELPTQLQSNIQVIQNTQAQLQTLGEALNRDRDRRLLVARQLADLQSDQYLADPTTLPAPSAASASVQLESALADLRNLELRVTPEHPDLLRARQLVADLRNRAQKEAAASASAPSKPLTAPEIAKRNKIKELQGELESLDRQMAIKVESEGELRASLDTYQKRIEAVPTRESELIAITRDYDTLQSLYRTLLAKKEDSKIAENLEQRQVIEQFKVLDPPRRPERPFSPNRLLIDLGGALGGLIIGFGLAALLEYLDKTVKVEADLRAVVAMPVIALIPVMTVGSERRKARLRQIEVSLALLLVFAICAVTVWQTFRV